MLCGHVKGTGNVEYWKLGRENGQRRQREMLLHDWASWCGGTSVSEMITKSLDRGPWIDMKQDRHDMGYKKKLFNTQ